MLSCAEIFILRTRFCGVFFFADLSLLSILLWELILEKKSSCLDGEGDLVKACLGDLTRPPCTPQSSLVLYSLSWVCPLDLMAKICLLPFLPAQLHTPSICLTRPIPHLRDWPGAWHGTGIQKVLTDVKCMAHVSTTSETGSKLLSHLLHSLGHTDGNSSSLTGPSRV